MRTYRAEKTMAAIFALMIFILCGCVLSGEDEGESEYPFGHPRVRDLMQNPKLPYWSPGGFEFVYGDSGEIVEVIDIPPRFFDGERWLDARESSVRAFLDQAPKRIREPVWIRWNAPKDWYTQGRDMVTCGLLVDLYGGFVFVAMRQNVDTDSTYNQECVAITWITDAYYLKPGDDLPGVPR